MAKPTSKTAGARRAAPGTSKASARSAAPKRPRAKAAAKAAVDEAAVPASPVPERAIGAEGANAEAQGAALRKKVLFERVVALSGAKKKDVKPIVEATLRVLGEALASGEDLVLPPFGKAKVNRQKDLATGELLVIRLRRNAAPDESEGGSRAGAKEPADEDDETLAEPVE